MMNKRLILAKRLLSKNGVIFISIDENEYATLKLLCDEIFGENNFIESFKWNKTSTPPSLSNKTRGKYEYVLCYEKYKNSINYCIEKVTGGDMPLLNASNKKIILTFPKDSVFFNIDGKYNSGKYDKVNLLNDIFVKKNKSNVDFKINGNFKWTQKTLVEEIKKGTLFIVKTKKMSIRYIRKGERIKKPSDVISKIECNVGTNEDGKKELERIFGESVFPNPKPISLIKYLINFSSNKSSTVLDFFAGSGTTGHSVINLNNEESGNRKFILCTNNEMSEEDENKFKKKYELDDTSFKKEKIEKTDRWIDWEERYGISSTVTQPRIKSVMKEYKKNGNGENIEGLGGNLEYFKTELVNIENINDVSDKKKLEFAHHAGQMLGLKEYCFKEITKNNWYQIFTDEKDKYVCVYFRENIEKLPELEKKMLKEKEVKLYIFSHSENDWKSDYSEYDNVTVEDIPEPILKVYKSLNN